MSKTKDMARAADSSALSEKVSNVAFVLALALLILGKFFLSYQDEIIVRFSPNDNSWFIHAASFLIKGQWLGPYAEKTLTRPPGYPLAIAWNHFTGLSLRLAHEFWLVAGAIYFAFSFHLPKYSRTQRWLFLALILFHPSSFFVGREAEGENLYLPMYLIFVGSLARYWYAEAIGSRLGYILISGISLACLAVTREEGQLLLGVLSVFAVLTWICSASEPPAARARKLVLAVCVPLLCYAGSIQTLKWMNRRWYEVAVFSDRNLPGLSQLSEALQKIQRSPPPHYVWITKETRNLAYGVSPTFRQIQESLEGGFGEFWRKVGCRMGADCNDLSMGWFGTAIMSSVAGSGLAKTPAEADAFYRQASLEIEGACSQEKLKCRKSSGSIVQFLYQMLRWKYFWPSFEKIAGMMAPVRDFPQSIDESDPETIALYDQVANRRPRRPTLASGSGEIAGWVYGRDPFVKIEALGRENRGYGATETFFAREDVTRRLAAAGLASAPVTAGFKLKVEVEQGAEQPLQIRFTQASGRVFDKPALPFYEESPDRILSVETVYGQSETWQVRFWRKAAKAYRWFLEIASGLAAATLLLFQFMRKRPAPLRYWPALLLLFAAVSSRFFALVVLDAVVYPIIETAVRYSYPIAGIYACLVVWILLGLGPSLFSSAATANERKAIPYSRRTTSDTTSSPASIN